MKITIKHRLEYAVARSVILGVRFLPESLAYRGISALGQLWFLCSKRRQGYALKFLRQAYPEGKTDRELLALARCATGNFGKVLLDMLRIHRFLRNGTFEQYIEGMDGIREHLGKGPMLVLSGHLGSWEAGAIALALARDEAHMIVRHFKNPLVQRFIENSRLAAGMHLHPRRGGFRPLATALKNGAVAVHAVDQNQRLRGLFVPFFGKIASTERAAATLAVRRGYPVAICTFARVGWGFRFRAVIHEVIQMEVPTDKQDIAPEVRRLVIRINRAIEKAILAYPEQYLWVHDRYRTQPEQSQAEEFEAEQLDGLQVDSEAG